MRRQDLRLLIVGPSLRYLGGQAVQAVRLVDGLRSIPSLRVDYLVVDPVLPGSLAILQRIPFIRTIATSIAYVAALIRQLPRSDVVHIFSASYWSFLIAPTPALLLGRFFGKRVILNYHSGEADDHLTHWGWHAKPLLRLADTIIVPTNYLVEVFARHGLQAESIANHLDVGAMTLRDRTTMVPVFFTNRNFAAHYNVAAIIEAFVTVKAALPAAELVVAGGGPLRADLEAQVSALGLQGVKFTGPVAPERMPALYAAADVYVNASLIDNMPLSLLEAYAAGVPVVTSDAGGIPWIAIDGETATVVPAGNVAALAAGMIDAVVNPQAAWNRANAARRFVSSEFSWAAVRDRWRDAYFEDGEHVPNRVLSA